jgi:flagellar basal body-associated protein FliL
MLPRTSHLLLAALLAIAPIALAPAAASAASASKQDSTVRFVNVGPYLINFFLDEKPVSGRLALTIEARDLNARTALTQNSQLIDAMVLPLAIELYSDGRPSQQRIRAFKLKLIDALNRQFGNVVSDVYIRSLM